MSEVNRMTTKTAAVLMCVAVLVLPGCARGRSSTHTLAFVTNNAADFWTIARKGTEKADAELPGVTVEFRLGDGTAAAQKRIVDDLLAKGVDGIAISPVDPANQTAMLDDAAQRAVVFTHDSDAPSSKRECYVGTDNVAAGRQAGELIKEALPEGGKIALFVGKLDARNAQERLQGIKDAIAGTKIEILDVRTDDTDEVRAKLAQLRGR
jgi:ribose transport system substrate-binding protein